MFYALLETAPAGISATQWVLIGLLGVLLIALPVMQISKRKKETTRMQDMTNGLRIGDTVLTTAGIIGKIVDIKNSQTGGKAVTLETGSGKFVSYITVDIAAVYAPLEQPWKEKELAEANKQAEKQLEKETAEKTDQQSPKEINANVEQVKKEKNKKVNSTKK
ncbi:MAG: preprotein translocase subunit YajC [Clostridia bacterium]